MLETNGFPLGRQMGRKEGKEKDQEYNCSFRPCGGNVQGQAGWKLHVDQYLQYNKISFDYGQAVITPSFSGPMQPDRKPPCSFFMLITEPSRSAGEKTCMKEPEYTEGLSAMR